MTDDGHMNDNAGPYAGLTPRGGPQARSWRTCDARGDLVARRASTTW